MTVGSAPHCTLSALIHYFIIKSKHFTVLQVLLQYDRMFGTALLYLLFSDALFHIEVEVMFILHYIHQDGAFCQKSLMCCDADFCHRECFISENC